MKYELQRGTLNDACLRLAKRVLWTGNETSTDIAETLAIKFEEVALFHVDFIERQQRDPNILTRAINYLAEAHAIPAMGTDLRWLREMLACLVELAVPDSILTVQGSEFLKDIQTGVTQSIEYANTP